MAFIRCRISPSRKKTPSYQIIETYREDGKVKQRVLANLGSKPTPELALLEFRRELKMIRERIRKCEASTAGGRGTVYGRVSLNRWRKAYARRLDSMKRVERFLSSRREELPSPEASTNASFLDWVMERNLSGWV